MERLRFFSLHMKFRNYRNLPWLVAAIAAVTVLPFIGLSEFYSKGEPREAIVAVSMLQDGNWILPENNGGDIPYKPPFLHWCIALLSLLQGHVSEFTSRLPSALSLVALVSCTCVFFFRRGNWREALLTSLLTLTAFEVHRAGMNCRVDMMLTAFMVGGFYAFYGWYTRQCRGIPWLAVLCMSGAMLTKGPVGVVLPCLVIGIFMLMNGHRFWPSFFRLAGFGLMACLLPLLWYVAAYRMGGDAFLDLVMEENFGRMTGTMSYDSHVHPFTYNFMTVIAGWVPWTLLVVIYPFSLRYSRPRLDVSGLWEGVRRAVARPVGTLREGYWKMVEKATAADSLRLYTWTALVVVFVFYCLPASKRSVYLLPCYPFMAALMARWMLRRSAHRPMPFRVFVTVMAVLAVALPLAFVVLRSGMVPDGLFSGRHGADNLRMVHAFAGMPLTAFSVAWLVVLSVAGVLALCNRFRRHAQTPMRLCLLATVLVMGIYVCVDGIFQPTVLNLKSDRQLAETLQRNYPGEPIYGYISLPMLHFFCTNFYMDDAMGDFARSDHESGLVLVGAKDVPRLREAYAGYDFSQVWKSDRRMTEVKDTLLLFRFRKTVAGNKVGVVPD